MSDLEKTIKEVVTDLENKIDTLSLAGSEASVESLGKINNIKKKSITALSQASIKLIQVFEEFDEIPEVLEAIDIVKVRSNELFNTALAKIKNLEKENANEEIEEDIEDYFEDTRELVKNASKEINDFFEKEEIKKATNFVKEEFTGTPDKAVSILKDWLKPEDK